MKRGSFLRRLFAGAAAVAVTPSILAATTPDSKSVFPVKKIQNQLDLLHKPDISKKIIVEYKGREYWYCQMQEEALMRHRRDMEFAWFGEPDINFPKD